ncbi:legumin A [Senna tora]|uniref:Legumin A n=1 Tax=Senna tora TaxID=362788 RepID=A0A834W3P6_9FABA|nr:legumin A [Senna tora]
MHGEECLNLSNPPRCDVSLNHPPVFSIKMITPQVLRFTHSHTHTRSQCQSHLNNPMAKFCMLFLPLCFLLLSSWCLGSQQEFEENECLQMDRLEALEPDHRINSEAGTIETWNPNNTQLKCGGVALSRCTMQPNGLRLPSYSNAPQLIYIVSGNGVFSVIFPGCANTFVEPQQQQRDRRRWSPRDRHQKIQHFKPGDVLAIPTGLSFWMYNNGPNPVVAISLLYTNSHHNQLDQNPRRFYLAGNQEQEFLHYQRQQQQRGQQGEQQEQQQQEGNNMFSGFMSEFLADAFNIDEETARKIQGLDVGRRQGGIIQVRGGLRILAPPSRQSGSQQQEQPQAQEEEEDEGEDERSESGGSNGLEETVCTMRLRHNLGRSKSPDIFVSTAGTIKTVNRLDFPVLAWLKLSAEHGRLRRRAMLVPHYNINSNSIMYVVRGRAMVQVVHCSGNAAFNRVIEAGQILMVPQNFAVAVRAESERFEYVSFKTSDRAMMATLAGRTSILRDMPEEVLAQSYQLRRDQASQLKNSNPNSYLVPPNSQFDD